MTDKAPNSTPKKTLYSVFKTDQELEKKGVVINYGIAKFTVKRAGGANREFNNRLSEKSRAREKEIRTRTIDEDESRRILIEVYAESVVLGWEGVTDENGNLMEFNKKNFMKLMNDLPDFWDKFRDDCAALSTFQRESNEEDGNTLGES